MSLVIKQNFVTEDLLDENGNKIGELKFNPNDSRIMGKLSKIVKDADAAMKKLKSMGDMPKLNKRLETLEDFDDAQADIEKVCNAFSLESELVDSVFKDLYEVFGKDTIDIFTSGTKDVQALQPLLDYIMPYISEARSKKVSKYIKKESELEVLE